MNEIELSGLGRPPGVEKSLNPVANRKEIAPVAKTPAQDTVELSDLPDLASLEASVEQDFAAKRSELQGAQSSTYPPLDTIDRVAAMLAGTLAPSNGDSES